MLETLMNASREKPAQVDQLINTLNDFALATESGKIPGKFLEDLGKLYHLQSRLDDLKYYLETFHPKSQPQRLEKIMGTLSTLCGPYQAPIRKAEPVSVVVGEISVRLTM